MNILWIRTEFLLKSGNIYNSDRTYYVDEKEKNEDYATHVAPTKLNIHLPLDFYASTARGKPKFWIERYLNGSFDYSEGSVYSDFGDHLVDPFEIPKHWEVIGGADFGVRDPTVLLLGAIDPDTGTTYIYDEYYQTDMAVPYHAERMNEKLEPIPRGALRGLVGDPSGKKRGHADNRSLFDHYSEYGIHFRPGDNRIEIGISKVQAYFSLDKLKIFKSCANTVKEGINYKYKPQELDSMKNADEKPLDKDNHGMDCLRYIIQELPDDPNQLKSKYYQPGIVNSSNDYNQHVPYALQENKTESVSKNAWYDSYY